MTITIAWVLNLDADLELADPDGFAPSSRQRAQTAEQGRHFLAAARDGAPADVRHEHIVDLTATSPAICQAWCPTPRAITSAATTHHALRGPSLEVLRHVNHKSFGARLAEIRYVWSMAELDQVIAEPQPQGWLLKRPFGFSGRGSKHIEGPLTASQRTWAAASMTGYGEGIQVEPFVTIEQEFAAHGWLGTCGTLLRGKPTGLLCDPAGAWLRSTPDPQWLALEADRVAEAFDRCATALLEAGYHGPFSIDAYRYRDPGGNRHLRALSEINARYSMGWFCGMREQHANWIDELSRQQHQE